MWELSDMRVGLRMYEGLALPWPSYNVEAGKGIELTLDPDIWSFVRECWNKDPAQRPSMTTLVMKVREICDD